jgi:hypothetical protein
VPLHIEFAYICFVLAVSSVTNRNNLIFLLTFGKAKLK